MAAAAAEPIMHNLTATRVNTPYNTSSAPSMADSLPALDFKFNDLRKCMSDFTRRFDSFLEAGRRRVLDERNQFRMRVAEVEDNHISTTRAIETLNAQTNQHATTLSAQHTETTEMQSAISSLAETRDKNAAHVASLRNRLSATKSSIATRKQALKTQQSYLAHQTSLNAPELEFWERYLGLRIEGTGTEDRVRFVFEGLDERKGDREAWFELDLGGKRWEVVECRPRLEGEAVEGALGCMREGEDLKGFLRGMRGLFVQEFRR